MGIFDKLMDTMHLGNDYEDDYDDYDDDFDDEPEPRGSLRRRIKSMIMIWEMMEQADQRK